MLPLRPPTRLELALRLRKVPPWGRVGSAAKLACG